MKTFIFSFVMLLSFFVKTIPLTAVGTPSSQICLQDAEGAEKIRQNDKRRKVNRRVLPAGISKWLRDKKKKDKPKAHPTAVAAMVIAILSILLIPVFGIGVILSIPAFILGLIARRRVEESNGFYGGRKQAAFAYITGGIIITLALMLLLMYLLILLFLIALGVI